MDDFVKQIINEMIWETIKAFFVFILDKWWLLIIIFLLIAIYFEVKNKFLRGLIKVIINLLKKL